MRLLLSHLCPDDVGSDGHTLRGLKLKVTERGGFGVESANERHALAFVPSHAEVEGGRGKDSSDSVHHAFEHDEEHGSWTSTVDGSGSDAVSVGLKTLGLVC